MKGKNHAGCESRHGANHQKTKVTSLVESAICIEGIVVMNEQVQLLIVLPALLRLHDLPIEQSVGSIKIHND